jgi:hypothetical protein
MRQEADIGLLSAQDDKSKLQALQAAKAKFSSVDPATSAIYDQKISDLKDQAAFENETKQNDAKLADALKSGGSAIQPPFKDSANGNSQPTSGHWGSLADSGAVSGGRAASGQTGVSDSSQPPPAIPMDPGAGGRCIGRDELKAGDIIVSREETLRSETIQAATASEVSHAYLVVDVSPDKQTVQVVEAVRGGVRMGELSTSVQDASLAVVLRDNGLTDNQRQQVADYATSKVGSKYDFAGALIGLPSGGVLAQGDPNKFFCSDLVARAYESAGEPLMGVNSKTVSPGDIANLRTSGGLTYFGHLKASK